MDMDKYITRSTGWRTFALHVEVDASSGERYFDIASVTEDNIRHKHAYLTEHETKELIEALKEAFNEE